MIQEYIEILKRLNLRMGLSQSLSTSIAETVAALSVVIVSIIIYFIIKFIIKKTVYRIIQLSTNKYDDLLIKNKVIGRICLLKIGRAFIKSAICVSDRRSSFR